MDLLERRNALAEALSSHHVDRVKPFLHPSYVIRGRDGEIVLDCRGFLLQLRRFFQDHPEYKQSIEVEHSHADESTAKLTTRHIDVMRTWWRAHPVPSEWDETWRKIGDEWFLLEERPHSQEESPSNA